jgi:phosphoribosylglycinamide formyltransferase-1
MCQLNYKINFNKEVVMLFTFNFYAFFCVIKMWWIMKKIVVFASGSGTNAENIIKYFALSEIGSVVAVFTNNATAKVIERAKNNRIPTEVFSKEELFEGKVLQKINEIEPDLIVLAGFLLKFPQDIIASYPNKIINIHPALLPKYGGKGMYGMNVHRAIVENKEKETGITIHYVNENYDEGGVVFQKEVALTGSETPEGVAEKIHELEQEFFPQVIAGLLE